MKNIVTITIVADGNIKLNDKVTAHLYSDNAPLDDEWSVGIDTVRTENEKWYKIEVRRTHGKHLGFNATNYTVVVRELSDEEKKRAKKYVLAKCEGTVIQRILRDIAERESV